MARSLNQEEPLAWRFAGQRVIVLGALAAFLWTVMLGSRTGLVHVGYASPHVAPSAAFSDYVWTTAVIALAFAVVAFICVLWLVTTGPKHGVATAKGNLAGTLGFVVVAGVLALGIYLLTINRRQYPLTPDLPPAPQTDVPTAAQRSGGSAFHTAVFRWEEAVIFAVILVLTVAAYLVWRRRKSAVLRPIRAPRRAAAEIRRGLDRGIDDLRLEPDLRRAIIAAYARMELVLAAHSTPREHWETSVEYLERVLLALHASQASIARLAELFQWAKFSNHDPEPSMRDEAIAALEAVR
jgi:hypothetical protein